MRMIIIQIHNPNLHHHLRPSRCRPVHPALCGTCYFDLWLTYACDDDVILIREEKREKGEEWKVNKGGRERVREGKRQEGGHKGRGMGR